MAFSVFCDNKGCFQQQEPTIDKETDEVYCSECGKTITNITKFAKLQMKALGQTRKASKQPYSFKCDGCKKQGTPILEKDVLSCSGCKQPLKNISETFKPLIINYLKNKS